jgi:hypothetical protein
LTEDRRATRWRSAADPCLNCGDPRQGRYCPTCGQRKVEVLVSVRTILGDVLEDQLVLNRALPRTLFGLFFKPGFLTEEYVRGRIVRYIAPFRLYLVASVLFFVLVSFIGLRALDRATTPDGAVTGADADSVRAVLVARRDVLAGVDTASLPAAARLIVRQSLADVAAALDRLDDSASDADPAALARIAEGAGYGVTMTPGTLQPWAQQLQFGSSDSWVARLLSRKVAQLGHLPPRDAVRAVLSSMLDYAPHMVFVLLPLFALLLKLLYIRRGRYYAEHFVFALHLHAFFFIVFILIFLLPWTRLDLLMVAWLVGYTWLAMKRVYRQGWFRTTLKWWILGTSYALLLALGLLTLTATTLLFA